MDKNTQDQRALMAILLSMGVYFAWLAFFGPPPAEPEAEVVGIEQVATDPVVAPEPAVVPTEPAVPTPAAPSRTVNPQAIDVDGPGWTATVSSANGALSNLVLDEYTRAPVVTPIWSSLLAMVMGPPAGVEEEAAESEGWSAYRGGDEPLALLTEEGAMLLVGTGALDDDGVGGPGEPHVYEVERQGSAVVSRRTTNAGVVITKRYAPSDSPFVMAVEVEVRNASSTPVERVWVGVADRVSGTAGRFANAPRPLYHVGGKIKHVYDVDDVEGDETEGREGEIAWFGMGDRYFMSVLAPEEPVSGELLVDQLPGGRLGSFQLDKVPLEPGGVRTYRYLAFTGPKLLGILDPLGHKLDESVEYGWFGFFSKLLLALLEFLQGLVVNWGAAIVLLTVVVKLLFFPLTQKAYVSSKRMQAVQPLLTEIREKYKDNRELQTQQTMEVFKKNGVNPMGGCLPMVIQMPVWFALYNVMLYSVELYDTSFLYLQDLTAADPYGVLPTMYALLMFGQQRMMPMGSMDPAQQRIIKMMPLIFSFFMFSFPSGLVLYFSVNMMLTIAQQLIINRTFNTNQLQVPA